VVTHQHFEWDERKSTDNIIKHGVSFYLAQYAQIFGAGYWRKVIRSMKKKIKYSDEPLNDVRIVEDFLPSPENLVFRDETVKVTISLSRQSVDFFKDIAKKHHTQYQKLIRRLLDDYTIRHKNIP
jgi:predicted DNA binding CopG/RHH family protein